MTDPFASLAATLETLRAESAAVARDRDQLAETLDRERAEMAARERSLREDLVAELRARELAERQYASVKAERDECRARLSEIDAQPAEIEALRRQIRGFQSDLRLKTREIGRLESERTRLAAEIAERDSFVRDRVSEAAQGWEEDVRVMRRQLTRAEQQNDALSRRCRDAEAKLQAAERQADQARRAMLDHAART